MQTAVEISLYPLADNYIPAIDDVIKRLNSYEDLRVETNRMSTQVFGRYSVVMSALTDEIRRSFESQQTAVFVMKILHIGDADTA